MQINLGKKPNKRVYKEGDIFVMKYKSPEHSDCRYHYQAILFPEAKRMYSLVNLDFMRFENQLICETIEECIDKLINDSCQLLCLDYMLPREEIMLCER